MTFEPSSPQQQHDAVQDARLGFVLETVKEIKDSVNSISCTIGNFQLNYSVEHQKLVSAGGDTERRVNKHDNDIKELTARIDDMARSIVPLIFANKILTWVCVTVGISVVGLIWSLITGQVHLFFH